MEQTKPAYLLEIVEVPKAKRIRCHAEGCGHSVYARIHVVLVDGAFQVLGGDCFQRLYGYALSGATSYYGGTVGSPTRLNEEMRMLLETNTAEFIQRLEARRLEMEAHQAKSRELTLILPHRPNSIRLALTEARRFKYPADDPSVTRYEGSAMLKWKWVQTESDAGKLTGKESGTKSDLATVVKCHASFDLSASPYKFALSVELLSTAVAY